MLVNQTSNLMLCMNQETETTENNRDLSCCLDSGLSLWMGCRSGEEGFPLNLLPSSSLIPLIRDCIFPSLIKNSSFKVIIVREFLVRYVM